MRWKLRFSMLSWAPMCAFRLAGNRFTTKHASMHGLARTPSAWQVLAIRSRLMLSNSGSAARKGTDMWGQMRRDVVIR